MTVSAAYHRTGIVCSRSGIQCPPTPPSRSPRYRHASIQFSTAPAVAAPIRSRTVNKKPVISHPAKNALKLNKIALEGFCYSERPYHQHPNFRPRRGIEVQSSAVDRNLDSTRPAAIEEVDGPTQDSAGRTPVSEKIKYWYRFGKSYLKFYKTGFKNVWKNYKEYRQLKKRLRQYTPEQAALFGGNSTVMNKYWEQQDSTVPEISRREYQILIRTRHDILKLIPFSFVFLVCGEFTPLVVLALGPSIVPYTCRIPQQEQKMAEKFIDAVHDQWPVQNESSPYQNFKRSRQMGIHRMKTPPNPILLSIMNKLFLRPVLVRRCNQILADTLLIHVEGGFRKLTPRDVIEYARFTGSRTLAHYLFQMQKPGKSPLSLSPKEEEYLKARLLPVLQSQSKRILNEHWPSLKPEFYYRRVLLGTDENSLDAQLFDFLRQFPDREDLVSHIWREELPKANRKT